MKGGESMKDVKHILDWLEAIAVKVGAMSKTTRHSMPL